jgi:hypothetical protein
MGRNALKGFPDLSVVLPNGHLAVIETKVPGKSLSKEQYEWREKLEATHVIYVLAFELQDVIEKFAMYGF